MNLEHYLHSGNSRAVGSQNYYYSAADEDYFFIIEALGFASFEAREFEIATVSAKSCFVVGPWLCHPMTHL